MCPVTEALEQLSDSGAEARGAIFTRREVVDFMLDLAGYVPSKPLHATSLLEPSFGDGDFLFPAVERLLAAAENHRVPLTTASLAPCIRAVELHRDTFDSTRSELVKMLQEKGVSRVAASHLAGVWLQQGDYLLTRFDEIFDFVVGNPPYVRQEMIPDALIQAYRELFSTVYDRADLYIPFIQKSLTLLKPKGSLAFICSDRWMKNRYGSKLRGFISKAYSLRFYIDMVNTDAFNTPVIAYPAITVISREKAGTTRIAHRPQITREALGMLHSQLTAPALGDGNVSEVENILHGEEPWLLEATDQLALVRRLESELPLLESTGCQVGIGVATGADKVFIGPYEKLDVEADRKLPLVKTKDIQSGIVDWQGLGVINPFRDDGGLVNLEDYPRLRAFLLAQEELIRRRNVARKNPANWYRTIDRIYPERTGQAMLLIPDIKGTAHIVYEEGRYYPHHNLYYITSEHWDLHALRAVLISGIARLFVGLYSTVMHGGFLRFQAQYLRRIRLPLWQDIGKEMRNRLIEAGASTDIEACNTVVGELYALKPNEKAAIAANIEATVDDAH